MKKNYILITLLLIAAQSFGQGFFEAVPYKGAFGTTDWTKPWANWDPANTLYPGDEGYIAPAGLPAAPIKVDITGDLNPGEGKEVVWTNNNYYELSGAVKVLSGTLKIQEGTVIRGKYASDNSAKPYLLVAQGAKIVAVGTAEKPIVFTSGQSVAAGRSRGDWGGVLIIGKAFTNTKGSSRQYEALATVPEAVYGGGVNSDDNDSSGALKYVRIEFAGNNPSGLTNSEINGLTFASIGKRTHADYIQVSFSQDDSFEWFGGTSMHKHLIAFASSDDDFDTDEGYRGKIQFALAVKHPQLFDLPLGGIKASNASNSLESDNNTGLGGSGSGVVVDVNNPTPITNVTFSNLTLVGPILSGTDIKAYNPDALTAFGSGIVLRTGNSSSVFNSIVTGYNKPLVNLANGNTIRVPNTSTKADQDSITMKNNVFGFTTNANRFASSNVTAEGWNIKKWIIAGPKSGVVGETNNDTTATTMDFKSGAYTGAPNGPVPSISFAAVDYSLSANSPYLTGAAFAHPKLASNLMVAGINDASETNVSIAAMPNPFSESTTISYTLQNASNVNISVYDMKGNIVAELANGAMPAGSVAVNFNSASLAKGIYVAKATTGTTVKTVKLIVK